MTKASFVATVGAQQGTNGPYLITPSRAGDPTVDIAAIATAVAAAVALVPATTTVAANVATLVADGASPTQAHVNTLNTNWGTFLTAFNTYAAAVAALSTTNAAADVAGNVTLVLDLAVVTSMNQLKAALRDINVRIAGTGLLTA